MVLCGLLDCLEREKDPYASVRDRSSANLSHVGLAAYNALRFKHAWHHKTLWNVTSGVPIGALQQTPRPEVFASTDDPEEGHDDWFPDKMKEVMEKTNTWCDVLSLAPPDGIFFDKIKEALAVICETSKSKPPGEPIIVRMMFGNIVGMPVNCDRIRRKLTKELPTDANVHLWIGAWRKGASWNHAKIIAVDGRYLHTGGHNMWDPHYLKNNPVHDLSIEMEGRVAHDGHLFANSQWKFIEKKQSGCAGQMAEKIPDNIPLVWQNRVIVSEWPVSTAPEFPPVYNTNLVERYDKPEDSVPVLSLGRLGALTIQNRPSDDAFIAMFDAANKVIRMSLQDLGPVCVPKTKMALPGLHWPKATLNALARAIWLRGVDIEIVVSNPNSIPGGLSMTDANYGNGWSCVDVAAELIKRVRKQFPGAEDSELRQKVEENLRICFVRHNKEKQYADGMTIGNHSKFFIIDDIAAYIGSQNLYLCDLAEWGVVVDDATETEKMIEDFWNPLWEASYTGTDCDVQEVMDGLEIDREGEEINTLTLDGRHQAEMAAAQSVSGAMNQGTHTMYGEGVKTDDSDETEVIL